MVSDNVDSTESSNETSDVPDFSGMTVRLNLLIILLLMLLLVLFVCCIILSPEMCKLLFDLGP